MLTKDLLAFRRDKNRIKPTFLDTSDWRYLRLAEQLLSIYNNSLKLSRSEIEEQISLVVNANRNIKIAKGINKICSDRAEFSKPGNYDYLEMRKKLFLVSAGLILTKPPEDYHDFRFEVFKQTAQMGDFAQGTIYGDLPQNEELVAFDGLTPRQLLERYNCALVQSLLFYATHLEVELVKPDAQKLRRLFKYLKFFRLLSNIKCTGLNNKNCDSPTKVIIQIDGPISLFENTNKYGLQLASFFPAIPDLDEWQLSAELKINDHYLKLTVDNSFGLVSHYRNFTSYVPEEIRSFHTLFKEKSDGWKIVGQTPLIHLGGGEVIFPDLSFENESGQVIHLELFHRWHMGQLVKRIEQMNLPEMKNLIVGVDRSLLSKGGLEETLNTSVWFAERGFSFRDFPGIPTVIKILNKFSC